MPKMKTNRGAAKRFSKTGTGKIRYSKAGRRHNLSHKAEKRMRRLRKKGELTGGDRKLIKQLIPGI